MTCFKALCGHLPGGLKKKRKPSVQTASRSRIELCISRIRRQCWPLTRDVGHPRWALGSVGALPNMFRLWKTSDFFTGLGLRYHGGQGHRLDFRPPPPSLLFKRHRCLFLQGKGSRRLKLHLVPRLNANTFGTSGWRRKHVSFIENDVANPSEHWSSIPSSGGLFEHWRSCDCGNRRDTSSCNSPRASWLLLVHC
jgi:hypothetical protein